MNESIRRCLKVLKYYDISKTYLVNEPKFKNDAGIKLQKLIK